MSKINSKCLESIKNAHKLNSLSYLKRVYNYNDKIKFEDKWDNVWVANWLKNKEVPKMDMLVSFKWELNNFKEINKIREVILHKGYKLKLYISILTLIFLTKELYKSFSIDSIGLFRKI